MLDHSGNQVRGISVVTALFVGFSLSACHPKPQQHPGSTLDQNAATDSKFIERMEKLRAKAQSAPGGAIEASDFASLVAVLFTQGIAKRRQISPKLVDEAVQCLDRAKEAQPDQAAMLLLRKGELLMAAGKPEPGATALRDSIAIRPNLRAFTPLAKYYAAQKKPAEIVALCKRTLPAMKSEESRYAVLDDCLTYSGSTAPEVGLGWAPPKEVSFYKARHHELQTLHEAAKREREKEAREEEKAGKAEEAEKGSTKDAKQEAESRKH